MTNNEKIALKQAAERAQAASNAYTACVISQEEFLAETSDYRTLTIGPDRVLDLLAERDADKKRIADLEESKANLATLYDMNLCDMLPGPQYMDPPDGGQVEPLEQVARMVEDYRLRIAELEESHKKLRETMAAIHNTIRADGAYTPLAAIMSGAKRAYEESAAAAGIKLEVGELLCDSIKFSANRFV